MLCVLVQATEAEGHLLENVHQLRPGCSDEEGVGVLAM